MDYILHIANTAGQIVYTVDFTNVMLLLISQNILTFLLLIKKR